MGKQKIHRLDANSVMRALFVAGYNKTIVREVTGASDTRIDAHYQQLLDAGMSAPSRAGVVRSDFLATRPAARSHATIIASIYCSIRRATTTDVDIAALTRAYQLTSAVLADKNEPPSICINRMYRLIEHLEAGRLRFGVDGLENPTTEEETFDAVVSTTPP